MEAYGLRYIIDMVQNIVLKKLTEANNGRYFYFDASFIQEMYYFYQNNSNSSVPIYLYIDPFTFHECFGSDHPDVSFSGDCYWYKNSTEVKFDPRFFGFFNMQPN